MSTTLATTATAASSIAESTAIEFAEATAYPNPFNEVVTLDLGQAKTELAELVIFDQLGREAFRIKSPALTNNTFEIDLTDAKLSAGMYFIKYTDTAGKTNTIKTIKR